MNVAWLPAQIFLDIKRRVHVAAFLQPNTLVDHHHEKLPNINANIKQPTEGPCNAAIY